MFFSGTLQEALASAVQNNKAVLCFVTDEGEESQRWESDFLAEDSVAQSIASAAVALRLKAGSREAGYLTAIFPVPKIPTVVVLRNGELKEYIPAGTSKDDFSRRVQSVLGAPAAGAQSSQEQSAPATAPAPAAAPVPASQPASPPAAVSSATEGAPTRGDAAPPAPVASGSNSSGVQNFLAERAARLDQQRAEAKKKALEAYARAQAKGKQKASADADADEKEKPKKGSRDELADAVKRRQRDAKEERKRILKRIEDDKAARRELAESKSRQSAPTDVTSGPSTSAAMSSDKAAILVRLHDGSTLRSRFAKGSSIRQDIRAWVDSSRNDGSTAPYKFRVVMNPTASRLIDETEEDRTLEDLGLTPSATLVLVPIPKFVTAAGSGGGIVQSTTSLFVWFFTLITTFFSGFLGGGAASRPEEHEMADLSPEGRPQMQRAKSSSSSRVQTLQDSARQRRDPEFYNGNSLNFAPRPEDEDQ